MKEYEINGLFEMVRKAPTELPREQVMEMITNIPALPPPGNSWFNINLNSIIMTTTVVAIIGSAMIYFSTPANTELPGQEPDDLSKQATVTDTRGQEPGKDSLKLITTLPAPARLSTNSPDRVDTTPVRAAISYDEPKTTSTESAGAIRPPTRKASEIPPSPGVTPVSPTPQTGMQQLPITADDDNDPISTKAAISINQVQLRKLKRVLLRELNKDDLIKSKRYFNVLEYKEGEILVNRNPLDNQVFTKYSVLLDGYGLQPGPEMRVVLDPKFIMVGRFTSGGFDGRAYGREMNIQFLSDRVTFIGMTDLSTGNGPLNLLHSDSGGGLFSKQGNGGFVDLSAQQLKSLKKALYKNLLADNQIPSKDADVQMLITPARFKVNENNDFSPELRSKYSDLFGTYGLSPGSERKILLSTDFIMVGDFGEINFTGSVHGEFIQSKIAGSIFESDFSKYSIFADESDHDGTEQYEERSVAPFSHLVVSGLAVVHLTQAPREDIRLEVSGMPIKDVLTEVQNDTLTVTTLGEHHGESIDIYVTNPAIHSLEISDSAELYGQNQFLAAAMNILIKDAAAAYLDVDVLELFILMDGGNLDIGGRYKGKEVRYGKDAQRGTLKVERLTRK